MFAQVKIIQRIRLGEHLSVVKVPDVVVAPQQVTGGIQKVQISQVRILKHLNFFLLGISLQNLESGHLKRHFDI